jgi:hypothetical protein
MLFPLSSSDEFCTQIGLATTVANAQFQLKTLPCEVAKLAENDKELTDRDLTGAFIALLLIASKRGIDLGEAVLKVLG